MNNKWVIGLVVIALVLVAFNFGSIKDAVSGNPVFERQDGEIEEQDKDVKENVPTTEKESEGVCCKCFHYLSNDGVGMGGEGECDDWLDAPAQADCKSRKNLPLKDYKFLIDPTQKVINRCGSEYAEARYAFYGHSTKENFDVVIQHMENTLCDLVTAVVFGCSTCQDSQSCETNFNAMVDRNLGRDFRIEGNILVDYLTTGGDDTTSKIIYDSRNECPIHETCEHYDNMPRCGPLGIAVKCGDEKNKEYRKCCCNIDKFLFFEDKSYASDKEHFQTYYVGKMVEVDKMLGSCGYEERVFDRGLVISNDQGCEIAPNYCKDDNTMVKYTAKDSKVKIIETPCPEDTTCIDTSDVDDLRDSVRCVPSNIHCAKEITKDKRNEDCWYWTPEKNCQPHNEGHFCEYRKNLWSRTLIQGTCDGRGRCDAQEGCPGGLCP